MVTDMQATKNFYESIFGWTVGGKNPEYLFFNPVTGVGGAFKLKESARGEGVVLLYVEVNDIPATAGEVPKFGGRVEKEKAEIKGGFGYFALIRDPSGNLIGLWSKT